MSTEHRACSSSCSCWSRLGARCSCSTRNSVKNLFFVASLLIMCAARGVGQATPTVNPSDPVYGFIDRLVAIGAVDTVVLGQRSMSEREVLRILESSRRGLPASRGNTDLIRESLDRYEQFYRQRIDSSASGGRVVFDRVGADL